MRNKLYRKRSISLLLALALLLSGITTDARSVFSYASEPSSTEESAEDEEEKSGESGGSEEKEEKKDEDSDSSEDSDKDHDSDKDRESGDKDDSGDNGDSGSSGSGENNSDSGSGEGSSGSQDGNGSGSDEGSTEASTEAPSESSEESPTEAPTEESTEGSAEHEHIYEVYISNEDGTHYSVCSFEGCEMRLSENCIYDVNGKCVKCGYEKPAEEEEATEEAGDTESDNEAEKEEKLKFQVLTFDNVRVEGNLPEITTLDVREIEKDEAWELLEEKDRDKEIVCAYDITLYHNGEVYQPDDSVKVFIEPPKDVEVEEIDSEELSIVHVIEDEKNETVDLEINDEGDFEFEADSFSPWVVVIDNVKYSIDYVEKQGSDKSFSQRVNIKFDDASLVKVGDKVSISLSGNITKEWKIGSINGEKEVIDLGTLEGTITSINNNKASVQIDFNSIPVYIYGKTGNNQQGGTGQYLIPDGFYGVTVKNTVNGYTAVIGGTTYTDQNSGVTYGVLSPVKNVNDAKWTTSPITITHEKTSLISPSFSIEWLDNRNFADKRPYSQDDRIISEKEQDIKNSIDLYYKDGDNYIKADAGSPVLVREGSEHPSNVETTSFSTWKVTFTDLPANREWYIKPNESLLNDGQDRSPFYQCSLGDGQYLQVTNAGKTKLTYTYSDAITGKIEWRISGNSLVPAIPSNGLLTDAGMKLYMVSGNSAGIEVNTFNIKWKSVSDNREIWEYSITGLPLYTGNGDAITYYTKMNNEYEYNGTKFKFTYDNGNTSTDTDKCFSGGITYATVTDRADYSFTKKWLDDSDENSINRRKEAIRKGITLYLWRYPNNLSIQDGAPVTKDAKQYTYKLREDDALSAGNDSLSIGLNRFSDDRFEKYDEKGYEYIYYVTEVADSRLYKTVYWNSDVSGYDGTNIPAEGGVKNGGTLFNVRSAKIAPVLTKIWNVAAVTDFSGSTCTFELQRKAGENWENVEEISLNGFTSSKKTIAGTFSQQDMYDNLGHKYDYRAIETGVKAGTEDAVFNGDWTQEGNISKGGYELNDYTYSSVSVFDSTVGNGEEAAYITVTDQLSGKKKLSIVKTWGGSKWNIGTDNDNTGDIEFALNRRIDGVNNSDEEYERVTMRKPA